MGADVYRLESHEVAVLDKRRIVVLRQSLGPERCREVVEEVVFHLTERLTLLEKALAEATGPRPSGSPPGSRASPSRSACRISRAWRAISAPASMRATPRRRPRSRRG
jgi:hypothetical protein